MWIIKNRISGEYDSKGLGTNFSKVNRSGWATIGHAKSHVAQKLSNCNFLWYMCADFIEFSESGTVNTIPVIGYLATYVNDKGWKLPKEVVDELEAYRHAKS